jgi:hypothetical protein
MERLTRDFLVKYRDLLGVNPDELELIRENLGPVEHMYFVSYRQVVDGIPVEGSTVNFRINHGNLIQVATEKVAPVRVSTRPSVTVEMAWDAVRRHVPDFPTDADVMLNKGTLTLVPMTPRGWTRTRLPGPTGRGMHACPGVPAGLRAHRRDRAVGGAGRRADGGAATVRGLEQVREGTRGCVSG